MEHCPSSEHPCLEHDLSLIRRDVTLGLSRSRATATCSTWHLWEDFCHTLAIEPATADIPDPIPIFQVFAHRYRQGEISPSKSVVRGRTVGDALRAVRQTMAHMGLRDPRLTPSGKLDVRLSHLLAAYNKADPPPQSVKPIPIALLRHTCDLQRQSLHPLGPAIADMLTLGFFYLLRPGEYANTDNPESSPFHLQDIHLMVGCCRINHLNFPRHNLHAATFACLEFTSQKNGVRGKLIGLGRSGCTAFCPVTALINRINHLRDHDAIPSMPLYAYHTTRWEAVTASILTTMLHQSATVLGPTFGLAPVDISVQSLCSSGAMALLCGHVDTDRIRLLGRWRSDEMLCYLHVQAFPVLATIAPTMLQHGNFTLIPNHPHPPTGGH